MESTSTTPLLEQHQILGAHFTEFAGWTMPLRYTSDVAEHAAVRNHAGLFDLSHMGEIEVTGPGSAEALDYALVGQPSAMSLGEARYTVVCADDGGILDDLVVYRLGVEEYLVVANAGNVATDVAALQERTERFEAHVTDATRDWALIAVQGPHSAEILKRVTDIDIAPLRYYSVVNAELLGNDVLIARTGYTGEDGFEIYSRPGPAADLWTALRGAGHDGGLIPAGLACRDTLRLEAGMPLYGNELTVEVTPFDAGLGRLVRFDKPGGFVGEEALRRHQQHPRHQLVGLKSNGRRSPRHGYTVLDAAATRPLGQITSGAPSPTLGQPIAMALVEAGAAAPGARLSVDLRGQLETVEVVPLPFYRRRNH